MAIRTDNPFMAGTAGVEAQSGLTQDLGFGTDTGPVATGGGNDFDWGGALGGAAQFAGAFYDYKGGRDAASALADTYGQLTQTSRADAGVAARRSDPYSAYRAGSAQQLSGIMSGEIDFKTDPGYQFRMDEATKETERAASARGFNRSGNVMAAVNQRAQDVASSEYSNIINRLTGLAGATPQNAIAGGQNYGNMMGNVYGAQLGQTVNKSQASASSGAGALISGVGSAAGDFWDIYKDWSA